MLKVWLRFFRVVNLPTVPGDVLVGAAAIAWGALGGDTTAVCVSAGSIAAACLASVSLYMFGLADNDILGADKDKGRPIPDGRISLCAARVARGLCLSAALVIASLVNLPSAWWIAAFLLSVAIVAYNRTKRCLLMGLCRGLNVVCGGLAPVVTSWRGVPGEGRLALYVAAAVWTLYIMLVTKYSEGEESDPTKRQFVGLLIGFLVYLQLTALLAAYLLAPNAVTRNLLLAGAGLLVALRLTKRLLTGVSAS